MNPEVQEAQPSKCSERGNRGLSRGREGGSLTETEDAAALVSVGREEGSRTETDVARVPHSSYAQPRSS